MNFSIDFEAENGLCVYRISGKLAPDELLSVFAMARAQPGWSDDYDFLTILDHVSLSDIRADSVTRMMGKMRENDRCRTAPQTSCGHCLQRPVFQGDADLLGAGEP